MNLNQQSLYPAKRFNYISFVYKNKFYIQGGTSIPFSELKDEKNILYCYPLEESINKPIATLMED
jgi:hypothetical protein